MPSPILESFRRQNPPTGPGLVVSPQLRKLCNHPGFLALEDGGQLMRNLYVDGSVAFEPSLLNDFGLACFLGLYDEVKQMVETGIAPDICGYQTEYRHGYLTLVVSGRQRIKNTSLPMRHGDVTKYLLDRGAPTEIQDIAGYTVLQHALIRAPVVDLARILLVGGANPDHQNKYGCTALMDACLTASTDSIDLLLEFGANPEIADADGCKPSVFSLHAGPEVSAVFTRWKRKRSGAGPAAREYKRCDACQRPPQDDNPLHSCARCKIARYCDVNCQRAHWPTHKSHCHKFDQSNTLTLTPYYVQGPVNIMSQSSVIRNGMGLPNTSKSKTSSTGTCWPAKRELPKQLVVKIQVPFTSPMVPPTQQTPIGSTGECLVYTKKRDLVCQLRRNENGEAFDSLVRAIRVKGVGGLKAYFAAEMKSKDELVIKVNEVLAEQPF